MSGPVTRLNTALEGRCKIERELGKRRAMRIPTARSTTIRVPRVALLAFLISTSTCRQPQDVEPGFRLEGEVVEHIVDDWTFTDDIQEIFIQTKTRYLLPHSTTIWCAALNGELYIGAYGNEIKRWEINVARNSAARLRIDGKLYDVTVTPLTSVQTISEIDAKYFDKYDMARTFGENVPKWRYYGVSQR